MPVALIVVGTGKWGANHVKTAISMARLAAVVDKDPKALESISTAIDLGGATVHTSLSTAILSYPGAAVVIATPPVTHFALAKSALLARRHVLVEKPFCVELEDAKHLVNLAKENNVVLMVDHLLQYSIDHCRLIQMVKSGYVGDVTRIRMSRLNFGTVRIEENVLWSFSPHDISIMLSLCDGDLPKTVSCVGQRLVSKGIEDHVDVMMQYENGVTAKIEASWMHPLKERRTIVYGTRGSIVLNEASPDPNAKKLQAFQWSAKRKADGSGVAIEKSEQDIMTALDQGVVNGAASIEEMRGKPALQVALEHFLTCIETQSSPRTDGEEALRVIQVLAAASESLRNDGQRIEMNNVKLRGSASVDGCTKPAVYVHPSAVVDQGAKIGDGSKIWHFSHIMPGADLGERCNIGQNVYIGGQAKLGTNVKVQNNVSIYDRVEIGDDAFLGPSCVFTNVKTPRSHVSRKHEYAKTIVAKGTTVGANATIVCGVTLGPYSFIGAGAVVTKDVPGHAMVYGNPAKVHGWVSTTGAKLEKTGVSDRPLLRCKESGEIYVFSEDGARNGGATVTRLERR